MKEIGLDRVLAKTIILLGKIQLEKNYLCGQMLKDFWCKTMKGLNKQCSLASILAKSFSNQFSSFKFEFEFLNGIRSTIDEKINHAALEDPESM